MDKELKSEIELFKIYALFVVAIITGLSSISYRVFEITIRYNLTFLIILFIIALIILIFATSLMIKSYFKIKKLQKQ